MHILFLNSWYPSKVFPTNGDFIQRHAEAVTILHRVTCIHVVTDVNQIDDIIVTDEIVNDVRTLIAYLKPRKNSLLKIVYFFKAYRFLYSKLVGIDFVHVNHIYPAGIFALYLKYFKNLDYLVSEHWTGFHKTNNLPWNGLLGSIMRLVSKKALFMCPVTLDLSKAMTRNGLKGNYHRIPNVVDTDVFTVLNNRSERFVIAHVSNMKNYHKNISGLLRTIGEFQKHVNEFTFLMIGDQPQRYLDQIIKNGIKESNVCLIDDIPQSKLKHYMQDANVFVLFSNEENLPCVILESFSCGVPVISTNVGGISEYFPDGFGKLIKKGSEDELLKELLLIYKNERAFEVPDKMHQYAVDHFSKSVIADQFSKLYNA